ncbi:MAG: cellulase family glycosylhydrolase [Tannerella sp.]|jgi:hypothetical protein|nr:cellulase family glycosylhydrolase [Tannerella sp.]
MKNIFAIFLSVCFLPGINPNASAQDYFLRAEGTKIVDGSGNEVLLRGIGLGQYMLIEPYMWGINSPKNNKSDTQQAILKSLAQLTGWDNVNAFLDEYRKNYMTEADVRMLKEAGFNSIRLPMHYNLFIEEDAADNTFREKGFGMIDNLLEWCRKHEVWLILDMHAVPGGQSTDKAISDQYSPGLWDGNASGTAALYQTKLIALWKEIARRYAGEEWIGGYDLINEIMYYPSRNLAPEIRSLYERITAAIRETDTKHILFIEGNGYANDHAGLTPPWDDNIVYSFHRYWSGNRQSDIQYMLNMRNQQQAPVWMGESGENSNTWFTAAVELLETNDVGWAWWAYKKLGNISGIVSVPRPDGWNSLQSFLESSTDNSASLGLNAEKVKTVLMGLAENVKLEKSKINIDVVHALMEQPFNNDTRPYGANELPGRLNAIEYDLGRNGFAYNETGLLSRESTNAGAYNEGWVGRNDAMDGEANTDPESNGFNLGWLASGEWLNYTVNVLKTGKYKVKMKYAVPGTGNMTLKLNNIPVFSFFALPNTGAWNAYRWIEPGEIEMSQGTNVIQVYVYGGFNYSLLDFEYTGATGTLPVGGEEFDFKSIAPNPVTANASFMYSLPEEADCITFHIYNMQGALVERMKINRVLAGQHTFRYVNQGLSPGIYQNQMQVEKAGKVMYEKTLKMIVE